MNIRTVDINTVIETDIVGLIETVEGLLSLKPTKVNIIAKRLFLDRLMEADKDNIKKVESLIKRLQQEVSK
jgi:hypothetical protein